MRQSTNLKTKRFILLFSIYFVFHPTILSAEQEETTWTVFVIAQTKGCDKRSDDLHSFFIQNLKDMARIGSNERLNILVQWEQPQKNGIWRYKATRGKLELAQSLPLTESDYPEKIVDFVRWGVANYPSKHIAIILSGHGSGITDPAPHEIQDFIPKKGILFNMEDKTYLNNQMLIESMQQINKILGKKIDLIGMDSCLMGGIETLYQLKDYAKIFVGSEEQEYAYGWRYSEIFGELASRSLNPFELANIIVNTYGSYYQNRLNWFTLSAINLEKINDLKNNLDQIITHLQECKRLHGYVIRKTTVRESKEKSLGFLKQWNEKRQKYHYLYVDFASFYSELHKNLQNLPTSEPIEKLKKCLIDGIKLIETIVIANVTGKNASQAKGISIYYPPDYLYPHFSYFKTKFAQESLWPEFLERIA